MTERAAVRCVLEPLAQAALELQQAGIPLQYICSADIVKSQLSGQYKLLGEHACSCATELAPAATCVQRTERTQCAQRPRTDRLPACLD